MIGHSLGIWQLHRSGEVVEPEPALISVSVSGTLEVGQTLTATVTHVGAGAISYVWKRDDVAISAATGQTYEIVEADAGTELSVTVSKVDVVGTVSTVAGTVPEAPVGPYVADDYVVVDYVEAA